MRIIYIHQYFVTPSMPGGTRSYEQARRLVELGHDVHVLTTTTTEVSSLAWRTTIEGGIHVHWLPVPYSNHMSFRRRIWAFSQFAILASFKAVRLGGDVIFATSTPLTVAIPGMVAARLRRARFVFEVRDLWPEQPIEAGALRNPLAIWLAFALARAAYRAAAHVIALSQGMADGVAAQGCPVAKISVVPNASDLDLFADADQRGREFRSANAWLKNRPLVVYAGAFGLVNGVSYLVRVAAEMARIDPEVRFLLVGGGAEVGLVRSLAEDLGVLGKSLFIRPEVIKTEVPAILGAATFATSVVVPLERMSANSANKFFDALAAGAPIAINHGGWQADLLRETGAGLVLDPLDVAKAAVHLAGHIRDQAWLAKARCASHELARTRFSRDMLFRTLLPALIGDFGK